MLIQSSQLTELLWTDPGLKSGTSALELSAGGRQHTECPLPIVDGRRTVLGCSDIPIKILF